MGVVNLTPDSFSDGGKYNKRAEVMIMQLSFLNQDQILLMLEANLLVQCLRESKLKMNGIELKILLIN